VVLKESELRVFLLQNTIGKIIRIKPFFVYSKGLKSSFVNRTVPLYNPFKIAVEKMDLKSSFVNRTVPLYNPFKIAVDKMDFGLVTIY